MRKNLWLSDDDQFLSIARDNNQTLLQAMEGHANEQDELPYLIPKLAHFIWLGASPLPPYATWCMESFRRLHPTWSVRLWRDGDIDSLGEFRNKSRLIASKNMGMRSDLLRYEVLRAIGGVYIDVDHEFIRPIDLLCQTAPFFCGLANVQGVELSNALLGSAPAHPLLDLIIGEIGDRLERRERRRDALHLPALRTFLPPDALPPLEVGAYTSEEVIALTGPGALTQTIGGALSRGGERGGGLLLLPYQVLNPVPNSVQISLPPSLPAPLPLGEEETDPPLSLPLLLRLSNNNLAPPMEEGSRPGESRAGESSSYERARRHYVQERGQGLGVVAVHWWQRAWQ